MPERQSEKVRISGNDARGYIVLVGERVIYRTRSLAIAADVALLAIVEDFETLERRHGVRLHAGR